MGDFVPYVSIEFAVIELNGYTFLFNTLLQFFPFKRKINSNNSVPIYQNVCICIYDIQIQLDR